MGVIDLIFSSVKNVQDKYKKYFGSSIKEYESLFNDPTLKQIFEKLGGSKHKLTNDFKQLPIVYACINSKARNISAVPWRFFKSNSDIELSHNDPIRILFDSPNMFMTGNDLFYGMEAFLCFRGEFFFYPDINDTYRGIPLNLWLFNPDDVKQKEEGNAWTGWEVKLSGGKKILNIPKEEMYLGKYWNPDNMLRGLSPISSLALTDSIRFNAMVFQDNFFKNDATPPLVFKKETIEQEANMKKFKAAIRERRGANNAGKELILHGGWDVQTLTPSNKDIQVLKILEATTDEICAVFGVPKTELSIRDGLNYATALSEDRSYWKKTLLPDMMKIKSVLNEWLNPLGYRTEPDLRSIPSLNYEWLELVEAAERLKNMGFKLSEINDKLGFGFEDVEDVQPQPIVIQPPANNQEPSKSLNPDKYGNLQITHEEQAKAVRAAIWKQLDDEVRGPEARAKAAVRKYFVEVERKTLRKLTKRLDFASVKEEDRPPSVDELLEFIDDEKLTNYIKGHIEEATKKGVDSIGVDWSTVDDDALAAIKKRVDKVTQINTTLKIELREMVSKAIEQGLSNQELTKQIISGFREKMTNAKGRAKTIARTEVNSAYSDGRFAAMSSTDPIGKKWISSRDSKVRDGHNIDGSTVKWNDTFPNGLKRPHDPGASAEEVINCRCKMVPIYDPAELETQSSGRLF